MSLTNEQISEHAQVLGWAGCGHVATREVDGKEELWYCDRCTAETNRRRGQKVLREASS